MASCRLHPSPPQPPPFPSSKPNFTRTHLKWRQCRRRHCFQCIAAGEAKEHLMSRPRTAQKSGLANARNLFDEMPGRGSKSGSAVIAALAHAGKHGEVVELFGRMRRDGAPLNKFVFPSVLAACVGLRDGRALRGVHGLVVKCSLCRHVVVGTALVDAYVGFGSVDEARKAFEEIGTANVVSWNVVVGGYVRSSRWEEAWEAFSAMQRSGVRPNYSILVMAMQTCGALRCSVRGRQVHAKAVVGGYKGNTTMWNCLIDMYAKCGDVYSSTKVFDVMISRDRVSWTAIISSYVRLGLCEEALDMFVEMQESGCTIDCFALGSGVAACARLADIDSGRAFHGYSVRRALDSDVILGSAIVDMYGKCGCTELARSAFLRMDERNMVSWDALLSGYVENGQADSAISIYREMESANLKPDQHTFVSLLKLCGNERYKEYGRQIHAHVMKTIRRMNVALETELVDMYAKCGCMEVARLVFLRMNERNLVSWNALISGYVEDGQADVAINVYREMESASIKPDQYTFAGLLTLCRYRGFARYGRHIHAHLIKTGSETNVVLQTLLVHMYVKCRRLRDAENVCRGIQVRNSYVQSAFSKVCREDLQALPSSATST